MTTSFYAPPSAFRPAGYVVLPDDEALHAVRVLRHRPGDEIVVVDGVGGRHRVRLDQADKRNVGGVVLETRREVGEPKYHLSIGLGLLKQRNRFETFLEKAVELGVSEVIPLVTRRTEKVGLKQQRAQNLLIAAMKQCGRCRLVELAGPQSLDAVLQRHDADQLLIAHEATEPDRHVTHVLQARRSERVRILVGPEGGFTDEEVDAARAVGYQAVSLGHRRLRAETAALVAASAVMLAFDNALCQ